MKDNKMKKLSDYELWDRLYLAQIKYIRDRFGKDVHINVGWASDDEGATSKVYGHGTVESKLDTPTEITFEEF